VSEISRTIQTEDSPLFVKDEITRLVDENPQWKKDKVLRDKINAMGDSLLDKASLSRNAIEWVKVATYIDDSRQILYLVENDTLLKKTFETLSNENTPLIEDDLFFFMSLLEVVKGYSEYAFFQYHEMIEKVIKKCVMAEFRGVLYLPLQRMITEAVAELPTSKKNVFADSLNLLAQAASTFKAEKFIHEDVVKWKSAKEYRDSTSDELVNSFISSKKYSVLPLRNEEKMHFYMYAEFVLSSLLLKDTLYEARHSSVFLNIIQSFHLSSESNLNGHTESGSLMLESISAGYIGLSTWGKSTHNPYVRRFIRHSISDSNWFSQKEQLRILKALKFIKEKEYGAALFYLCSTLESSLSRRFTLPDKAKKEPIIELLDQRIAAIIAKSSFSNKSSNTQKTFNEVYSLVKKKGDTAYMESTLAGLLTQFKRSGNVNIQALAESAKYILTRSNGLNIRNTAFHGRNTIYESEWGTGLLLLLVTAFSFVKFENGTSALTVSGLVTSNAIEK